MAEMEGLSFKLVATTTEAKRGVDSLNSSLKKLNTTMSGGGAKKATVNLRRFSQAARSAAKSLISMQFNKLASSVKNVASKFGSLGDKFKRILLYRGIRTLIREITQSFGEGIKNLYGWSQIADGRFAASMDRISTSFLYFKNSIGAAVAPLINALAPAIDFVIDKVVALLNMINQLFAKLTGATYWTKANKVAKQYADNASAAGGAAKEAMRYLAPFDELNRLPSDSGGGGGGGSSGSDYSDMFEIQNEFSENIANFAEMIKAAWESDVWEDVGKFIGGKVNELVENIDWAGIGTNVGKFINALFSVQYWTLDEINFTNIGSKIAEFLNNAIANINWDIAGRLPVKKLTSIIDTVLGFLSEMDWALVGSSISDYLNGSLDEFNGWFEDVDWDKVGKDLYNAIDETLKNIDWAKLWRNAARLAANASSALGSIGESFYNTMSDSLNGSFDRLWEWIGTRDWFTKISNWFSEHFIIADNGGWDIDAQFTQMFQNIKTAFSNAFEKAKSSIQTVFINVENFFIEKWNSFIDKLQSNTVVVKIADFLGIDLENAKIDPIEIPVTANITDAKDNIPADQRLLGMGGNMTYWQRGWGSSSGYNFLDIPALLPSWKRGWGTSSTYNLISIKASLPSWQRGSNWYTKGWDKISMTAVITKVSTKQGLSINVSTAGVKALGGAFFGGSWHDIPQYASGTLNAGSMFVAGEAGPELVGHIGGRTEVLNASQIASAIAAGVAGATYSYDAQGMSEEMLYNAFVRALNDSDIGGDTYLDGEVIYRSVQKHNQMNTKRTGVNAFA